jgi:hypothetical protein
MNIPLCLIVLNLSGTIKGNEISINRLLFSRRQLENQNPSSVSYLHHDSEQSSLNPLSFSLRPSTINNQNQGIFAEKNYVKNSGFVDNPQITSSMPLSYSPIPKQIIIKTESSTMKMPIPTFSVLNNLDSITPVITHISSQDDHNFTNVSNLESTKNIYETPHSEIPSETTLVTSSQVMVNPLPQDSMIVSKILAEIISSLSSTNLPRVTSNIPTQASIPLPTSAVYSTPRFPGNPLSSNGISPGITNPNPFRAQIPRETPRVQTPNPSSSTSRIIMKSSPIHTPIMSQNPGRTTGTPPFINEAGINKGNRFNHYLSRYVSKAGYNALKGSSTEKYILNMFGKSDPNNKNITWLSARENNNNVGSVSLNSEGSNSIPVPANKTNSAGPDNTTNLIKVIGIIAASLIVVLVLLTLLIRRISSSIKKNTDKKTQDTNTPFKEVQIWNHVHQKNLKDRNSFDANIWNSSYNIRISEISFDDKQLAFDK